MILTTQGAYFGLRIGPFAQKQALRLLHVLAPNYFALVFCSNASVFPLFKVDWVMQIIVYMQFPTAQTAGVYRKVCLPWVMFGMCAMASLVPNMAMSTRAEILMEVLLLGTQYVTPDKQPVATAAGAILFGALLLYCVKTWPFTLRMCIMLMWRWYLIICYKY